MVIGDSEEVMKNCSKFVQNIDDHIDKERDVIISEDT